MSAAEKDFAPRTLLEKPAQLPLRSFHAENLPPTAAEGQKGMSYTATWSPGQGYQIMLVMCLRYEYDQ